MMVVDGHGGASTTQFLREHTLTRVLQASGDGSSTTLHDACTRVFASLHAEAAHLTTTEKTPNCTGATCTVVIFNVTRRELSSANVGDSEAILVHEVVGASSAGKARDASSCGEAFDQLTTSHRLTDSIEEQQRLAQVPGCTLAQAPGRDGVGRTGPLRAWPGGLGVTRGIGDADCGAIVSCEPAWRTLHVPDGGGVVVACSDGVWDALSFRVVAKLIYANVYESVRGSAREVVRKAVSKRGGLLDDTTAVMMWLPAVMGAPSDFVESHLVRGGRGRKGTIEATIQAAVNSSRLTQLLSQRRQPPARPACRHD